jgi:hypothetical protein
VVSKDLFAALAEVIDHRIVKQLLVMYTRGAILFSKTLLERRGKILVAE